MITQYLQKTLDFFLKKDMQFNNSEELSLPATLSSILQAIGNVMDAYSVVLFLPAENGEFQLASYVSLSDKIIPNVKIKEGEGLIGWILRNKKELLAKNFDQGKNFLGYYEIGEEKDIKVFLGCPLPNGQGAICIDSKKTYSLGARDQKILGEFGKSINMILNELRSSHLIIKEHSFYKYFQNIQTLRTKFPKWKFFMQNFIQEILNATKFSNCLLAVRNEDETDYFVDSVSNNIEYLTNIKEKFPLGSGSIGWVFKNEMPVFSSSTASEASLFGRDLKLPPATTLIALPIFMNKKARAVLVIFDENEKNISPELKYFINAATEYLALFLENLYLRNCLRQNFIKNQPVEDKNNEG